MWLRSPARLGPAETSPEVSRQRSTWIPRRCYSAEIGWKRSASTPASWPNLLQGSLLMSRTISGHLLPAGRIPGSRMKLYLGVATTSRNRVFEGPSAAGRSHAAMRPGE